MRPPMKSMVMTPNFAKRLAGFNGVVIPSRVPQGEGLYKKRPSATSNRRHPRSRMICIICEGNCLDQRGLRNHFVTCVERNGNPQGARWDDPLKGPAAPRGTQSSESMDVDVEGPQQLNDYGLDNAEIGMTGVESFAPDGFETHHRELALALQDSWQHFYPDPQPIHPRLIDPQLIDPQLASLNPSHTYLHDPDLNQIDPQLECWSPFGVGQQGPCPGLEALTNQALFSMVQDWQDVIYDEGGQDALEHPQFLELMGELVERGVITTDWRWSVDTEDLDMGFARVVKEGWGS